MSDETLPITGLPKSGLPADVLVCGDPARAAKIASQLQESRPLSQQREYHAYSGYYGDRPVAVCSHGVGAPGAAPAFEELIRAGARRLIRVGTCGGMQPEIDSGHLVIATGAVQHTGFGREIAPPGYPALASPELVLALQAAAAAHGQPHHRGIVITRDAFYQGVQTPHTPDYAQLAAARVQAVEMECAALFLIGSLRGVAAGAILVVDGNVLQAPENMDSYQPHRPVVSAATDAAIAIALEALRHLDLP